MVEEAQDGDRGKIKGQREDEMDGEGGRGGEDEGEDKKGPGVDTTKRQKRRLDYTSPAARSLFGRNRFFITKSFAGLIPNCTFATLVKLTGIARTHRGTRNRGDSA